MKHTSGTKLNGPVWERNSSRRLTARWTSIREMPELYAVVHRDTRRAMLVRFPYSLLYRLVNKQVIVVACFHGKRDPRRWQSRT